MRGIVGVFFLLFILIRPGPGEPIDSFQIPERPVPHRYVNDFAQVLNADQNANLENELRVYSDKYHQQIAVVTMENAGAGDLQPYTEEMIRKWRIGFDYDEKGVLILVNMNTKKVYIGVGDGLEQQLTPTGNLDMIKRDVIPAFTKSDYYGGLRQCINGIEIMLIPLHELKAYSETRRSGRIYFILAGFVLVLSVIGYIIFFPHKKSPAA
jgi:uncharacterized protein